MTATIVPPPQPPSPDDAVPHDPADTRHRAKASVLDRSIIGPALRDRVVKLDPGAMAKNPVMFVVEVGAVLSTVLLFTGMGTSSASEKTLNAIAPVVLWVTVLFANSAEAMAEARGKAQAATLRQTRTPPPPTPLTPLAPLTPRAPGAAPSRAPWPDRAPPTRDRRRSGG